MSIFSTFWCSLDPPTELSVYVVILSHDTEVTLRLDLVLIFTVNRVHSVITALFAKTINDTKEKALGTGHSATHDTAKELVLNLTNFLHQIIKQAGCFYRCLFVNSKCPPSPQVLSLSCPGLSGVPQNRTEPQRG